MAINLAENLQEPENLEPNSQIKSQQQKLKDADFEKDLTPNELQRLKDHKTSYKDLVADRMQLKATAEAELNRLVKDQKISDLNQYKTLKEKIDKTNSPEKTQQIIDEIRDITKDQESQRQQDKDEQKELDPENPRLLKLQKKFTSICEDNEELIGTAQLPQFKNWFIEEKEKNPTVGHLKGLIKRLEGKEINDKGGLAPRRVEYLHLTRLFKNHGFNNKPTDSKFIAKVGLSERQQFRHNIEKFDQDFKNRIETFYSQTAAKAIMKELLFGKPGEDPSTLLEKHEEALKSFKKLSAMESQGLTQMAKNVKVGGFTIKAFSKKSKRMYLEGTGGSEGYSDLKNFKERMQWMAGIESVINNEAKFAKELGEVYKDDPEGLKLALGSFEELSYQEKEKAIQEHKNMVEEAKDKSELHKELTIKAAHGKIDASAANNTIARSTQEKYKEWFKDPDNYKNPETQKPGDLETLKKCYAILVSSTPDGKARNLSAYAIKRDRFKKEIKELRNINPSIKDDELNKWQEDYDQDGWTERKAVYKELKIEQAKQQKEQAEKRAIEKEAGIKSKDPEKESSKPERAEVIRSAIALINDEQAAEALKTLLAYNEQDPDDKDIIFWMEVSLKRIKEFGSGKKIDQDLEKEIEKEIERVAVEDELIAGKIEEEQITHLSIHNAQISENHHDKEKSAHERAKEESLNTVQDGSLEADLIEDFYDRAGDDYILDKGGMGEEINTIDFTNVYWNKGEREQMKQEVRKEQGNIETKEGSNKNIFQDNSGRQISAKEADTIQEFDIEDVADELGEAAEENITAKLGRSPGAQIFNINERMAENRKAKDFVEEKVHQKLEAA